jgi:hypothetical protein
MQDDTRATPPKKEDEKPSFGDKVLTYSIAVVAAPFVACWAVGAGLDAAGDFIKEKVRYDSLKGKASDKVEEVYDFVEKKMDSSEAAVDPSTVKLAKGAGKIGYGLVRGGLAIAGLVGHGLAGYARRNHNPKLANDIIKHGWEAAQHNIEEGAQTFQQGLDERRGK